MSVVPICSFISFFTNYHEKLRGYISFFFWTFHAFWSIFFSNGQRCFRISPLNRGFLFSNKSLKLFKKIEAQEKGFLNVTGGKQFSKKLGYLAHIYQSN